MAQLGDRLAGAELVNETLQNASNKFFRVTMLDQWTKFVQTTSYASGKLLIKENIEALAANGSKPLNKRLETMAGELAELGIDYKQGVKWFKGGSKVTDEFYDSQVLGGAARYTNSVILQPTSMSGLKPLLHSNPKTAIAFQLLGYPVAFTNTVLKGAAKQLVKDPVRNTAKIATAATIMTGMARWTNYVRSDGASEEGKDLDEILYSSVARWGGNGILLDTFARAQKTAMYSQNAAAYGAMPFGPVVSDTLNLFQQGIIPVVGQKLPFYTAFAPAMDLAGMDGRDQMQTYRKHLLEIQRRMSSSVLPKFEKSIPVVGYSTGGEVTDVPNVPTEPDERIDKLTGRPYNEQAGTAYMDKVDDERVKKNIGGAIDDEPPSIIKIISNNVGDTSNPVEIKATAFRIKKSLKDLESQGVIKSEDPKVLNYVTALIISGVLAPSFKSINDLEKIPSWKKAAEAFSNEKLWEKAQVDLGVTNKQQVALETIATVAEKVDPEGAINSVVTPLLSTLAHKVRASKNNPEVKKSVKDMDTAASKRIKKNEGGVLIDPIAQALAEAPTLSETPVSTAKRYYGRDAVNKVVKREGALTSDQEYVVEHEGFVGGEYKDTKGISTSGVGQTGKYKDMTFKEVFKIHQEEAKRYVPKFDSLSENQQKALMSLVYRGDLQKSPTFRKRVNEGNFEQAAVELLDHEEYREYKRIAKEGGKVSGIIGRLEEASKFIKG